MNKEQKQAVSNHQPSFYSSCPAAKFISVQPPRQRSGESRHHLTDFYPLCRQHAGCQVQSRALSALPWQVTRHPSHSILAVTTDVKLLAIIPVSSLLGY